MKRTDSGLLLIVIYVNELIITGDSEADVCDSKLISKQKFKMEDFRELSYFLDIEVIRSLSAIQLLQRQYRIGYAIYVWDDRMQAHFNPLGVEY